MVDLGQGTVDGSVVHRPHNNFRGPIQGFMRDPIFASHTYFGVHMDVNSYIQAS